MKSFTFSIFIAAWSLQIFAQKPTPKADTEETDFTAPTKKSWLYNFEKRQTKMIQLLRLTEPQKRSLDTLNDRFVTQRVQLQEENTHNLRARLAQLEILRRERETKFRNLLTDAQLEKWNNLRKGQRRKTFKKK